MSKLVKVASVMFETKADLSSDNLKPIIFKETAAKLEELKGYGLDLIVFCESVAAYGQTFAEAESMDSPGDYLNLYMDYAENEKCHIAASIKIRENDNVYNSIAYIDNKGEILGAYHKNYLVSNEIKKGLTSGSGPFIAETEIGRIGGIICFDLNFEAILKKYTALKPDILTFSSMYHGGFMQQVWAYYCRSFFVSALPSWGAGVVDPLGQAKVQTCKYNKIVMTDINLDRILVHLDYNQTKFADIMKKYLGEVKIEIPPHLAPAIIYSTSDQRTAMDIAKEFELKLLDDYFDKSLKENDANRK